MDIISTMSFKGGVGKTNILMVLASAYAEDGYTVRLIDSDQNAPLTKWEEMAKKFGRWSDHVVTAMKPTVDEIGDYIESLPELERQVVLIDTKGGASEFHRLVAENSDVVLVPTRPNKLDGDEALKTFELFDEIERAGGDKIDGRLIFSNVKPPSATTADMRVFYEVLQRLPHVKTALIERSAYNSMPNRGLLGETLRAIQADNTRGIERKPAQTALDEARALAQELQGLIHG